MYVVCCWLLFVVVVRCRLCLFRCSLLFAVCCRLQCVVYCVLLIAEVCWSLCIIRCSLCGVRCLLLAV